MKRATILLCTPDIQSDITRRCLDSLFQHTYSRLYKLVVADNRWDPGFSHPHELNRCLKTLDTDFLVTLDDDVILTPEWLEALLEVADNDPSIGAVGCVHTFADGSINHTGGVLQFSNGSARHKHALTPISTVKFATYICSACSLLRKSSLLFDESYAKYYFELDYGLRLWECGLRVAVSPHKIRHLREQQMRQRLDMSNGKIKEAYLLDEAVFSKIWYDSGRLDSLYRKIRSQLNHPDMEAPELPQAAVATPAPTRLNGGALLSVLIRERLNSLPLPDKGKVALFGTGKHTARLERILAKSGSRPNIAAILDDNPEGKPSFFGLAPVKAAQFDPKQVDAIVLSTDSTPKEMASRCRELYGQQIRLVDLYEGLPPGPYDMSDMDEQPARTRP